MSKWVSTEDELPKDSRDVLVYDGWEYSVAYYRERDCVWTPMSAGETVEGYDHHNKDIDPTHWMYLPEPPLVAT